jgi:hypothetical protein
MPLSTVARHNSLSSGRAKARIRELGTNDRDRLIYLNESERQDVCAKLTYSARALQRPRRNVAHIDNDARDFTVFESLS